MSDSPPTDDIMRATYRALCEHGYADVTMEDIAAKSEKSKSALHYHYESKHALLLSFLDDLLESFTERLDAVDGETPRDRLGATVDAVLDPDAEGPDREFKTAVLEMKAQGPYDDAFRRRLADFDRTLHDRFADALAAGVESGDFRSDLDVDETAEFFVTVCNGAQTRSVAVGRSTERTRRTLERYVESDVLATADPPGAER
ncbi:MULTISPECIES: TetR/AcrR family transcriptional regulator [Halorussus]|uniref:TetR/AcrR family transcriptional regulator n=1 Tax=Halorussus TaxID=1070314 RepID=UPI00209E2225|nr:TetR/AcrR family transcriptional regulator [Halorussus vallis]USZ77269.1 TetR family transcriptional regulator [Halorussus vallis]